MASDDGETPGGGTADFTGRLLACRGDGEAARRALADELYGEMRAIAERRLARERVDHTLQPTALVHEAWMRLADQTRVDVEGRSQFLALAAQAMRRILVDHARGKRRAKRGGGWRRVELDADSSVAAAPRDEDGEVDLIALDDALGKLRSVSERQARVVELRFFGGLEVRDVADVLGVSVSTVEREWRFANAWLAAELGEGA